MRNPWPLIPTLLIAVQLSAQTHSKPAASSPDISFVQQSTTLVSSKPVARTPSYHDYHGTIVRELKLSRKEVSSSTRRLTIVTSLSSQVEDERIVGRRWSHEFPIDRSGGVKESTADTSSPIVYKNQQGAASHHRQGLAEYGGSMLDYWRLVMPERARKGMVGDWWEEKQTTLLRDSTNGVDQEMGLRISYTNDGPVDTLNRRTIRIRWRVSGSTSRGIVSFPGKETTGQFSVKGQTEGVSYFSAEDGMLIADRSTERVKYEALGGLIELRMESTTTTVRK
jgi:hypothetical protein